MPRIACLVIALILLAACARFPALEGPLEISKQGSFIVGGRELRSAGLSVVPEYASGTVTVGQMYVRYQVPAWVQGPAMIFVHGCCLTGKTWETTPDGRMGWDEYFLRRGHPVYVVDQVARGRSATDTTAVNLVKLGRAPAESLPRVFAAGHESLWDIFRFGPEYGKVHPGLRFPVAAAAELWKQIVPDWNASLPQPNPTVAALSELATRLDGAVIFSHSQSGVFPLQAVAIDPRGIVGIVMIEPAGCPDAGEDVNAYRRQPILVVWGDFVEESPRWGPRMKACKAFATAVTANGGRAENMELTRLGIHGNSHMLMQDTNNLEIADLMIDWLRENVRR